MIDPNFKRAHGRQAELIARASTLTRWLICAIVIIVVLGILLVNKCGATAMAAPSTPSKVRLIIPVSTLTSTMDRSGGFATLPKHSPRSTLYWSTQ